MGLGGVVRSFSQTGVPVQDLGVLANMGLYRAKTPLNRPILRGFGPYLLRLVKYSDSSVICSDSPGFTRIHPFEHCEHCMSIHGQNPTKIALKQGVYGHICSDMVKYSDSSVICSDSPGFTLLSTVSTCEQTWPKPHQNSTKTGGLWPYLLRYGQIQ